MQAAQYRHAGSSTLKGLAAKTARISHRGDPRWDKIAGLSRRLAVCRTMPLTRPAVIGQMAQAGADNLGDRIGDQRRNGLNTDLTDAGRRGGGRDNLGVDLGDVGPRSGCFLSKSDVFAAALITALARACSGVNSKRNDKNGRAARSDLRLIEERMWVAAARRNAAPSRLYLRPIGIETSLRRCSRGMALLLLVRAPPAARFLLSAYRTPQRKANFRRRTTCIAPQRCGRCPLRRGNCQATVLQAYARVIGMQAPKFVLRAGAQITLLNYR
jgi:hypothetical protein